MLPMSAIREEIPGGKAASFTLLSANDEGRITNVERITDDEYRISFGEQAA
jgi:hypothetical protein